MHGCGQHTGMLARAIVVDRPRIAAGAQQLACRAFVQRPLRPASKQRLVHSGLATHRFDMDRVAAMGRASNRELLVAKAEGVCGPAFDEWDRLQHLNCRAGKHRALDVAQCQQAASIRVRDGDGAAVPALDERAAHYLDENRIIVRHQVLGGSVLHDL